MLTHHSLLSHILSSHALISGSSPYNISHEHIPPLCFNIICRSVDVNVETQALKSLAQRYKYPNHRKAGVNKLIRILHKEGKYGFSLPLEYSSVPQLIHHFKVNSLSHYNSGLDICLTVPLPRPLAVSDIF